MTKTVFVYEKEFYETNLIDFLGEVVAATATVPRKYLKHAKVYLHRGSYEGDDPSLSIEYEKEIEPLTAEEDAALSHCR